MSKGNFIKKLKKSFDYSLEGIVISDIEQTDQPIVYCNPTFLKLTGYDPDDILGKNCRFLQQGDRDQKGLEIIRNAIKNRAACKVILRNYKKSGELFYNRLSVFPLDDTDGSGSYFVGFQDDVTEIIDIERQLGKAKKDNQILLSEIHHRVKNNLAVFSSLLQAENLDFTESSLIAKSQLRVRAMAVVHEEFYQQDGFSKVDLSTSLKKLLNYLEDSILQNLSSINLKTEIQGSVILSVNEAIPLALLLSELICNVYLHAYPEKKSGVLILDLKQQGKVVTATVEDNGVGICEDLLHSPPLTTGMLIVESLCKQLAGNINYSNKPGGGLAASVEFQKSNAPGSSQSYIIPAD